MTAKLLFSRCLKCCSKSPTMPVVQVSNVFILDPVRRSCSCDAVPSLSQSDTYPDAIQVKSNMCTNTEIQRRKCEIQIQKNGQAGQAEGSPHRRDVCSPCNLITNGSMFPPLLHQHHNKYKYKYSCNESSPAYFIPFYATCGRYTLNTASVLLQSS